MDLEHNNGQSIAYQVSGKGALDIIFILDWVTNLEVMREEPTVAQFLDRLASFGRLIFFDKRGSCLSDPIPLGTIPTPEGWMDDVRRVLDDIGSERAALLGHGDGGYLAEHIEGAQFIELAGCDHFFHAGDINAFLDAVHIGARVMACSEPGRVLVSRTVKDLVAGSGLEFTGHNIHKLKGVAEEWELFFAA